ncbi:putative ribonuclease H-like domain-containing protein [Tanacetum coccineum]
MYSVDLKNVVPQGDLTCLFAKATSDESNLWHRRLGHVNFKTMNNYQSSKHYNVGTWDLFGQYIGKGVNEDDVLPVVPQMIIVKVIQNVTNGTEFKNRVMNQFCEMKGIKREFSVARTPQQNGVAKRKNRTLIEAARTMLADSKLRTTFWAEAVNTSFVAGNQSNGNAGTKACDDTGKARVETVPGKDYILLPLWTQDPTNLSIPKGISLLAGLIQTIGEEESKDAEDPVNESEIPPEGKDSKVPNTEEPRINQEKDASVNAASIKDNVVDENIVYRCADDPNIPDLEEIGIFSDAGYDGILLMNKKDERGIVIKNKARLMDVNSAFLYGKIEEEVCVCQPLGFEDTDFPDRVYKVEKALYGLHQAPRAWYETLSTYLLENRFQIGQIGKTLFIKRDQGDILIVQMSSMGELTLLQVKQKEDGIFISQDKYVTEILKKFGFSDVKTANTPMETHKPLLKDADGEDIDEHMYRSMIGSLMYLTSSRPDIIYLKGQPKLGLWYPKDSPFDLVAYTNSDYIEASLDRKSITGGCQFLGCRLISWQCKK